MTSIKTASVVIRPSRLIIAELTPIAISVATADAAKNIANSTYQTNSPGVNTNHLFISQQKTLANTKPIAVATANRKARRFGDSPSATDGKCRKRTAQSVGVRHFKTVEAIL